MASCCVHALCSIHPSRVLVFSRWSLHKQLNKHRRLYINNEIKWISASLHISASLPCLFSSSVCSTMPVLTADACRAFRDEELYGHPYMDVRRRLQSIENYVLKSPHRKTAAYAFLMITRVCVCVCVSMSTVKTCCFADFLPALTYKF